MFKGLKSICRRIVNSTCEVAVNKQGGITMLQTMFLIAATAAVAIVVYEKYFKVVH